MSEDDQCFELRGQTADVEEDFRESEWPFSGRGKLDDVPIPTGGACVEISNVLGRAAEHTRDFSFGGQAASLPAVMGLLVDGVGNVSLPICRQQAEELIACCEKSPFGHNMNTVMDERVRKSWQLGPSALTIKNPLWHSGIEELSKLVGERLGYQRIPLQCVLYKLLLYGEGGHFEKHQDTEKEDGMIATLVVQLPSLHEGGDLVVYRCGKEKYRQDFGKADGTAPFLPHYAVHYADAEHAVERVTSGYRVVLVYSICLPTNMRHLERDLNKPMDGDLAVAISKMDTGNDFFSLLLSHEYTSKSIENFGSAAFKGVDRARFHALQQANIQAPSDKKLHFFIAKLRHKVEYLGNGGERIGDWKEWCRTESVTWYSTSGDFIGESDNVPIKLNFLNPCAETLSQLWKPHGSSDIQGYMGNEGPNKDTTYGRYAIVAWPIARHLQHTLELLSLDVAAVTLEAEKPVGQEEFRRFVDAAKVKLAAMDVEHQAEQKRRYSWKDTSRQYAFVSIRVCNALCRMLIEIGNPALVYPFFTNFIVRLKDKSNVMKYVTRIIEAFEWRDLGQALLQFVSGKNENYVMEAAMQVVELWTLIFCHCDEDTLKMLTRKFHEVSPRLLKPGSEVFTNGLIDLDSSESKFMTLVSIINRRVEWLNSQIRVLEMPFSWEMPVAEFPDNIHVLKFLHGSEVAMTTKGLYSFETMNDARMWIYQLNIQETSFCASYRMRATEEGGVPFVTVTKTHEWFNSTKKELPDLIAECKHLAAFTSKASGGIAKRARLQ